jgi:hypothetical protein
LRTQVLHSLGFQAEDPERYDENDKNSGEEYEFLFSQGCMKESHDLKYLFFIPPLYDIFFAIFVLRRASACSVRSELKGAEWKENPAGYRY